MGSFLSLDLFVFFIFFEIVLVPMYFLIAGWGYENRVYAATKFFLYTMFGSAFMLVGIIATVAIASKDLGYTTFDLVAIAEGANFAASTGRWLFFAIAIGFAVKVPIFPLHTWLPDAHTQAPTAGSVVLAGVMLKLGTYGLLRFGLYLFPEASYWSRPLWLTLAVIGIIYGAIAATMQMDLKRLVAYSSIAHLGFIVLGTFAFTTQSLSGGVLQMINHGVSTGALFLMVGMIYERRKTRQISELSGLQKVAPIFAAGFLVVMLSSIGVPGLNGFIGEFLILTGSFLTARWWTVVAAFGVILAALYLLWAYQRVFHGEPDEDNKKFRELGLKEGLVLLPFLGLIVFMGVYPKPVLDRIEPSVNSLITHVEEHTDYVEPVPTVQIGDHDGRLETATRPTNHTTRTRRVSDAAATRHLRRSGDRLVRPLPDAHPARWCVDPDAARRVDAAVATRAVRPGSRRHRGRRRRTGDVPVGRHHRQRTDHAGRRRHRLRPSRDVHDDHDLHRRAARVAAVGRRTSAGPRTTARRSTRCTWSPPSVAS